MNPKPADSRQPQPWLRLAIPALILLVVSIASHLAWRRGAWPLHGLPAFFLGWVILVGLGTLIPLAISTFKQRPDFRLLTKPEARSFRRLSDPRRMFGREAARIVLGGLVLAGSAVVLFYTIERWRGSRAWSAVVEAARRAGESLDLKSMTPPPVPADQDFGQAPLFAPLASTLTVVRDALGNRMAPDLGALEVANRAGYPGNLRLAPWLEGQPTDLGPWLKASRRWLGTNHLAEAAPGEAVPAVILRSLTPLDPQMEELRTYSGRPYCRLPFENDFPYFSEPHSERVLAGFMRLLRLRASAALVVGRVDDALADVQLALRLAEYRRQQPTLYHHLPRAYDVADALQPLWEGLAAQRWREDQIETVQSQLRGFHPLADLRTQLRYVALGNAAFIEGIVPTVSPADATWSGFHPMAEESLRWIRRLYPTGWSLQNQATICQWWLDHPGQSDQGRLATGDLDPSIRPAPAMQLRLGSSDPFFPVFIVPKVAMMNETVLESLPFAQAVTHLAEQACGLERHRLHHGDYPETLEALVPGFLDRLPDDPMRGGAYGYHRTADRGFVLYSVGSNRVDDQGRPCPRRLNWNEQPQPEFGLDEQDWAWASPPRTSASPAEK